MPLNIEDGFQPGVALPRRTGGARLRLVTASMTNTGTVLFALDTLFVVLGWPLALWWAGRSPIAALLALPFDARIAGYPIADLAGAVRDGAVPARRDPGDARSLARVPLVVGMGALLAVLVSLVLPLLDASLFCRPGGGTRRCCSPWRSLPDRDRVPGAPGAEWTAATPRAAAASAGGGRRAARVGPAAHAQQGRQQPATTTSPSCTTGAGRDRSAAGGGPGRRASCAPSEFAVLQAARESAPTRSSLRPTSGAA